MGDGPESRSEKGTRDRVARWRTRRSEQRFHAVEARLWSTAACKTPEVVDCDTRFGATRVYRWSGDGEPIVLLHGGGMTSRFWVPYVSALVGHEVLAVDMMGDVGRSEQLRRLQSAVDVASWLDETLGHLAIDRAHLVGHSLGGFVGLGTASHRAHRVASLTLFDPLGIAPIRLVRFMAWGFPVLLGSLAPRQVRGWLGTRLRNPLLVDEDSSRQMLRGAALHLPGYPLFSPLRDAELDAVATPVHLVVAGKSEPFDAGAMAARAEEHLRRVSVRIVPDAGHALPVSHLDLCVAEIERAVAG